MRGMTMMLASLLVAVTCGGPVFAGGPRLDFQCYNLPEVERRENLELQTLMEARPNEHGRPTIEINPIGLSRSSFSRVTLEFLYQRECARIELGHVGIENVTLEMHQLADCLAIEAVFGMGGEYSPTQSRTIDTIERDLWGEEMMWPSSLGPRRTLALQDCRASKNK